MATTIEFRCPECQHYYRVKRDAAGKRATCNACSSPMTVPQRSENITRAERWAANQEQHLVAAEMLGAAGAGSSWQRGFLFLKQSLKLALDYKASMLPIAISIVACISLAVLSYLGMASSRGPEWEPTWVELFVVLFPQYLIFYFCMGMTIRMVFGYLIGQRVSFGQALSAAIVRLPNIVLLALIGTLFDMAIRALRDRGFVGQLIAAAVEAMWTTASFLMMPAIMIDGETFTGAVKKTKDAVTRNLIPIAVGEVAVRAVTWVVSVVATIAMVGVFIGLSAVFSGAAAMIPMIICFVLWVLAISVFNVYVRTVYYTSLYVWTVATEEATKAGGRVWVPAPLAESLA